MQLSYLYQQRVVRTSRGIFFPYFFLFFPPRLPSFFLHAQNSLPSELSPPVFKSSFHVGFFLLKVPPLSIPLSVLLTHFAAPTPSPPLLPSPLSPFFHPFLQRLTFQFGSHFQFCRPPVPRSFRSLSPSPCPPLFLTTLPFPVALSVGYAATIPENFVTHCFLLNDSKHFHFSSPNETSSPPL